jgi:hypothetical protein
MSTAKGTRKVRYKHSIKLQDNGNSITIQDALPC